MITSAIISTPDGSRHVSATDLPLSLGGEGATLVCAGLEAGDVVAYVGVAEGHAFIQPARSPAPVTCDEATLEASTWLQDGGRVRAGASMVHVATRGHALVLTVSCAAADSAPDPAVVPPPSPANAADMAPAGGAAPASS